MFRKLSVIALAASAVLGTVATAHASDVNWDKIALCESGGNWHTNTGNGYYGGLQFSMSTWRGNGGSGNPANASRSEQIRIAERVLDSQGLSAWPECGVEGHSQQPASIPTHAGSKAVTQPYRALPAPAKPATKTTVKPNFCYISLFVQYVVKPGDTMYNIARTHGTTWQFMLTYNPQVVDPNLIYPGEVLTVPIGCLKY
jgi:hypothetical protein